MNQKVKKLLRRYGKATETTVDEMRRRWLSTPRKERPAFRQRMRETVAKAKA